ncbi:MAG: hypothetical protein HW419_1447 [Deltaproteobacteria bacterium]|nr:hypothetical protein [Deltaproteobacteria bacterium]
MPDDPPLSTLCCGGCDASAKENSKLFARDPSESVTTGLDNDERFPQLFLRVHVQNSFQFLVHGVLSGRQHTKVKDPRTQSVDENQPTKISISCDKEAALILGGSEQIFVISLRKSDFSHANNIMREA